MKKKVTLVIIICIILVGLTSCKSTEEKEIDTGYNIFLFNTVTNSIYNIGDQKYNVQDIKWSENDRYFMFINENAIDEIKVFRLADIKQIEIPKIDLNKSENVHIDAKWFNNTKIVISNENSNSVFDREYINIEYEEDSNETNQTAVFMDNVPENIVAKIKVETGLKYFEGYITYEEKELIFRAEDFQVYHMDLTTGKLNKLFNGFNVKWSPGRTKISYNLHKNRQLIDLNEYDGYDSESLVTYVYDLNTGKSTKIADFGTSVYFSHNDKYIVFFESAYDGLRGAI